MQKYVKVVGLKIDSLDTVVVGDANRANLQEAAEYAEEHDVEGVVWLVLPCYYDCNAKV